MYHTKLKLAWSLSEANERRLSTGAVRRKLMLNKSNARCYIRNLIQHGWIEESGELLLNTGRCRTMKAYQLTPEGKEKLKEVAGEFPIT
jgi:predicted ArsR family transcriptional regulator